MIRFLIEQYMTATTQLDCDKAITEIKKISKKCWLYSC